MGSNSLESNGSFAHAATDLDASPDLDDALVQQGLSMYQAARDAGRDFGFQLKERDIPIRVHNGKIEFEIDLPRDIRQTNCFPSEESRRSERSIGLSYGTSIPSLIMLLRNPIFAQRAIVLNQGQ